MPEPSEPEIVAIANRTVEALRQGEAQAVQAMARQYQQLYQELITGYEQLYKETEALRQTGEAISPDAIRRLDRYQSLMNQTELELRAIAARSEAEIANLQREAIGYGMDMAEAQFEALLPPGVDIPFNRLPIGALEQMIGFLADGSPLKLLLDALGRETAEAIGDLLLRALGLGWSPRKLARAIQQLTGMALTRAMKIARTEQLRAWRRASITGYRDQPVIIGYKRHAQQDTRTCAACLLKDGEFYRTDEEFTDHIQGRCAVVPVTRSWAELGFKGIPETEQDWPTGKEWFLNQPEATQRGIIGDPLFNAWQGNEIALEDMAYLHRSQVWGDSWQAASLKRAKQAAEQRRGVGG